MKFTGWKSGGSQGSKSRVLAFEFAVEGRQTDAEQPGGLFLVATGTFEGALDMGEFLIAQMLFQRREGTPAIRRGSGIP